MTAGDGTNGDRRPADQVAAGVMAVGAGREEGQEEDHGGETAFRNPLDPHAEEESGGDDENRERVTAPEGHAQGEQGEQGDILDRDRGAQLR